jgi:DNA-binding PadR family transcriptional regulator
VASSVTILKTIFSSDVDGEARCSATNLPSGRQSHDDAASIRGASSGTSSPTSSRARPASGSELIDEIAYYTDWRPTPGAIYPLLAQLEAADRITLVDDEAAYLKRYALTPTGRLVVDHRKRDVARHVRSLYRSYLKIYATFFLGLERTFVQSQVDLSRAIEAVSQLFQGNPDVQASVQALLDGTAARIAELAHRLDRA